MTLILSRPLPFDIPVEFLYTDLTATRGKLVMYYVILIVT